MEKLKKKKETRRNRKDGKKDDEGDVKDEKKDSDKDENVAGKLQEDNKESEQDALVKSVRNKASESVIDKKDDKSIPKIKSVKTETHPIQGRVEDGDWKDGNEEDEEEDEDDDEEDDDGWEWDYGHPTNKGESNPKDN